MKQIIKFISKNLLVFSFGVLTTLVFCVSASILFSSSDVTYDNVGTGMSSTNVQDAIDELFDLNSSAIAESSNVIDTFNARLADQKISKLYNGVEIKRDMLGDYYFDFDGVDDYIQLYNIPSSVNWQDGFTIEAKASWTSFNNWSRILDLGNGSNSDNIIFSNYERSDRLIFSYFNGGTQLSYNPTNSTIVANEPATFKGELIKNDSNYTMNYYKNGTQIYTMNPSIVLKNIERTKNYIGKSNWTSDGYFKGRIYSIKVTLADGTVILDIDVNKLVGKSKSSETGNVILRENKITYLGSKYTNGSNYIFSFTDPEVSKANVFIVSHSDFSRVENEFSSNGTLGVVVLFNNTWIITNGGSFYGSRTNINGLRVEGNTVVFDISTWNSEKNVYFYALSV